MLLNFLFLVVFRLFSISNLLLIVGYHRVRDHRVFHFLWSHIIKIREITFILRLIVMFKLLLLIFLIFRFMICGFLLLLMMLVMILLLLLVLAIIYIIVTVRDHRITNFLWSHIIKITEVALALIMKLYILAIVQYLLLLLLLLLSFITLTLILNFFWRLNLVIGWFYILI